MHQLIHDTILLQPLHHIIGLTNLVQLILGPTNLLQLIIVLTYYN
jgi:hypothetical protein